MFRKFFQERLTRTFSDESEDGSPGLNMGSPKVPPALAFEAAEKQKKIDANTFKVEELAPFDACIEACDELASTSTSSGRVDSATGLVDCSVLVSADGELLIIPQQQQKKGAQNMSPTVQHRRAQSILNRTASELGEEYNSAIFLGNDLHTTGDKALNGFTAKGWSIPAASLAMKQSADVMADLADFVEDLVLTKKSCAAQESQMVMRLRPLVEGPEQGGLRVDQYQQLVKDTFPDQSMEVLPTRVGPLSSPGGTVQATLVALDNFYSTTAESESQRWKKITDHSGALSKLKTEKTKTDLRSLNRQAALQEMFKRAKAVEDHLTICKEDAARKWDEVHQAEEKVTHLVEEKMMERSRMREQQRLEQLKQDEAKRAKDTAHGNLGATSSEIWDIVSAVAASMEEGSFEPMDLPQAPVAAPRDKSKNKEAAESKPDDSEEDLPALPMAPRHELEQECGLPELRVAAMAADEAVNDAANSLLNILSNWDTVSRSSRLAAETCLVSACNAQASCLRAVIDSERESIQERLKLLDELEDIASSIDVRADMNHYITMDKKESGGRSLLGDDDDGGVASALAVLNNHIDGNMGMGTSRSFRKSIIDSSGDDHAMTPEHLETAVEQFFRANPSLQSDAPDGEKTQKAQEEFEINVLRLCKIGKEKSSSGRSRRSTICYTMNARRSTQSEIPSVVQFDGICRVFFAVLSGCDTDSSGASLAKMLMTLSHSFFVVEKSSDTPKEIYVKTKLGKHPLWEKEEFWDQALYQTVAESLTHSGVMANFDGPASRIVTATTKKKSEWTEAYKMKWHDLKDQERYEAASQVHAVVFAQIGALAHSMIEFGCGLERSSAFVRRMSVRNQLPLSQRAILLQHLMERESDANGTKKAAVKLTTPSR